MIRKFLTLDCSPAAAFSAFTDEKEVTRWWGSDAVYRTVGWKGDPRPGGQWRAKFSTADGQSFGASGEYVQVEAPSVLDWTWAADWDPAAVKHISMRFEAATGGTLMTITSDGNANEEERIADERGWDEILGWLANDLTRERNPMTGA
jgi:uncharacterized protein YndB with AHSA1/START domain